MAGSSGEIGNVQVTVARYLDDGTMDETFGDNGTIFLNITPIKSFATDIEILKEGKILLGGYTWDDSQGNLVLIRLNKDGSVDTTFGLDGYTIYDAGGREVAQAIEVQEDGKILIAGNKDDDAMIARFNKDGFLDESFGQQGWSIFPIGTVWSYVRDIAIQDDGNILATGFSIDSDGYHIAMARLNPAGKLNLSFGDGGTTFFNIGRGNDFSEALVLQDDGKILIGAHSWVSSNPILKYDYAVVRLNSDGTFDTSYGENGFAKARIVEGENYTTDILLQENGKAIIIGNTVDEMKQDLAILRFNADGSLDTTFGKDGKISTDINGRVDKANAAILDKSGKILLVGFSTLSHPEICVLRYRKTPVSTENALTKQLKIYPNPVRDKLYLRPMSAGKYRINIFDVQGRHILQEEIYGDTYIDISDFHNGLYFLKVKNATRVQLYRFIKI